ncbi:MAG: hypothetical protein IPQ07_10045 [Myxococcales bacterium]|nr:hypothetical protein [Myxococcales bacterium]
MRGPRCDYRLSGLVRIRMGLLRYLVQGFGWEIGRHAAKEGIAGLETTLAQPAPVEPPPTPRELRAARKQARKAAAHAQVEAERKRAEIEAELQQLKRRR